MILGLILNTLCGMKVMERRVINRIELMQKLDSIKYENISELQMHMMFRTMGKNIEVEEEKDDVDCNTN